MIRRLPDLLAGAALVGIAFGLLGWQHADGSNHPPSGTTGTTLGIVPAFNSSGWPGCAAPEIQGNGRMVPCAPDPGNYILHVNGDGTAEWRRVKLPPQFFERKP